MSISRDYWIYIDITWKISKNSEFWKKVAQIKTFAQANLVLRSALQQTRRIGKTGVTADRDKIEFRLFNSSSIFNITLREELFSSPKQNQTMHSFPGFMSLVTWVKFLGDVRYQMAHQNRLGMPHLLQTRAGFEDFKQLYMPNAHDQILSLSQLVEAGYVPHFQPSAQKSWLIPRARNGSPWF